MLRPGNVHSAHNWREVLDPIVARYGRTGVRRISHNSGLTRKQEMGQGRGMSILVRIG